MGFAVSAENGEVTHQGNEMFDEPENVIDIQEDMLNDIYDKATEVSLFSWKTCIVLHFFCYHVRISICLLKHIWMFPSVKETLLIIMHIS